MSVSVQDSYNDHPSNFKMIRQGLLSDFLFLTNKPNACALNKAKAETEN